jgi:putative phosphoesterase
MRILLIADIHSNRHALDAIREPFDVCLCMGDLVEYGPDPAPVVDWVRSNALACVRGNHDHGAAQNVRTVAQNGFKYLTMATRPGTIAKLSPADLRMLNGLPTTTMLSLDGKKFLLVHATPRDPLDEYAPADPNVWSNRLMGIDADFVLVGHTHVQFSLPVGRTTVVNPGAVGLPRDGDPSVRYAIIENGRVDLKSCEYDVEKTVAAVQDDPMLEDRAKAMLTDVYRNGRLLQSLTNGLHATLNGSYSAGN